MSTTKLNPIDDIKYNVYVKASAGTGKTYTLTNRYLAIVDKNLGESSFTLQNILAITFTKAAALEMRTRIRKELNSKRNEVKKPLQDRLDTLLKQFDRANILTIDALEGQILRENPVEAGLDPNYTLLSEEEYGLKIKEEVRHFLVSLSDDEDYLKLRQKYDFGNIVRILVKMVKKDKRELLYSEELLRFEDIKISEDKETGAEIMMKVPEDCLKYSVAMLGLYRKFEEYFNKNKDDHDLLSFSDVARRAVELLEKHPEIAKKYQDLFRYIMVDEFQDTNESQRKLVYLLTGDATGEKISGEKLFIVGDRKQSIYCFRGAEVKVFDDVCGTIEKMQGHAYTLDTNRRSYPAVLNYVNEVFGAEGSRLQNYAAEKLVPYYSDAQTAKPILNIFTDTDDLNVKQQCQIEAEAVAGYIKKVRKEMATVGNERDNVPKTNGKIAVLLKASTHIGELIDAFNKAQIPYSVVGDKDFYLQQEVQDLYNLFCFLNDYEEDIPLLGVLRSPYFALSDEEIGQFAGIKGECLWYNLVAKGTGERAERAKSILSELLQSAKFLSPAELWQRIFRLMNVEYILLSQQDGREQNYNQLLANVEKFQKSCLEQCNLHGWGLSQWMEYLREIIAESRERAADLPSTNAVEIMTMHKSKGLQFETVILPFLNSYKSVTNKDGFMLNGENKKFALKSEEKIEDCGDDYKKLDAWAKKAEEEENARLFYVACTRAEKRLYLSGFSADKGSSKVNQFMEMALAGAALAEILQGEMFVDNVGEQRSSVIKCYELSNVEKTEKLKLGTVTYFTPSRLQTYLYCQRQYYYQYGCGLPGYVGQENIVDASLGMNNGQDNLTYAERGALIHAALEYYHGDKETAWIRAVQNCGFVSKECSVAKAMYLKYVDSELFRTIPMEHQREVKFQLPIEDGVIFGGVIDCLYGKEDGTYGVVDYKTGRVPAELDQGYGMQLGIYAQAVEKMRLGKVSELQLHYLQGCKKFSIIDKKETFAKALKLAKEIQEKKYEQDFTTNGTHCCNCDYAYLCPAAGLRTEERTAPGGE